MSLSVHERRADVSEDLLVAFLSIVIVLGSAASAARTETEKQYDISRQKAARPGKRLNVDLSLELERGAHGQARILGRTNLPHGMALMLGLRGTASKYFAQDNVDVADVVSYPHGSATAESRSPRTPTRSMSQVRFPISNPQRCAR